MSAAAGLAPGRGRGLLAELGADRLGFAAALFLVALVALALLGPALIPRSPAAVDLSARLLPPGWLARGRWDHPLGTDHLGRDVLVRILAGARVSLLVASLVVALAGGFGILTGGVAGYFGGRADAVIMRWVDIQVAFPGLLLALLMLAVIGPSVATLVVVLSFNGWMIFARLTRGLVLSLRHAPHIEAAETLGCTHARILVRHVLPELAAPLLTLAVLEFAHMILAEAALSFLGVGVQPPATSWGLDLAAGRNYVARAWWLVTFPGLAIALTVFAVNVFASWLRLMADPFERDKMHARAAEAGGP